MRENACEDCVFFDYTDRKHGFGVCRRHAPALNELRGTLQTQGAWPRVAAIEWCGEFEPGTKED